MMQGLLSGHQLWIVHPCPPRLRSCRTAAGLVCHRGQPAEEHLRRLLHQRVRALQRHGTGHLPARERASARARRHMPCWECSAACMTPLPTPCCPTPHPIPPPTPPPLRPIFPPPPSAMAPSRCARGPGTCAPATSASWTTRATPTSASTAARPPRCAWGARRWACVWSASRPVPSSPSID